MLPDWLIGLIMGMVEGLTEFLPVSSTGHLILTADLINFGGPRSTVFEVVIQLGSILAVVVVFWKRLWSVVGIKTSGYKKTKLNLIHIIIGAIPAGLAGVVFHDFIKNVLFSSRNVVIGLVAGGILLIVAERFAKEPKSTNLDQISYTQAFLIGCFQVLALWPGFSRSGSTIAGGLLLGLNRKTAAEFTFILAVPMMIGASGVDLIKSWNVLSSSDLTLFITGFITAFIVALLAIVFFLKLLEKVKLTPFAIYRFIIAIVFTLVYLV
ncbi:undecaprenyl-diphosphate phosphatase [Bacillus sp. RG28]|uniref:Undecaprenyl-diphosphatase n=1 Tax=Gottfriedia endophytica TaxID=2820819 RepID=A0A940NLI8_9BACI|nr:undecaprenyl-diphosphate phosphatase [Gottfriedia endophytica]MBP0724394.1 undecaprenyl-diphosphate phosphatase [Gottfriedia endophytica]